MLAEDFNGRIAAAPITAVSLYHNRLMINNVMVATGSTFNKFAFYSNGFYGLTLLFVNLHRFPTLSRDFENISMGYNRFPESWGMEV